MILYGKKDLGYKVLNEVIINGVSVVLLSDDDNKMNVTIYQVIKGASIIMTSLDASISRSKFFKVVNELLKNIK